MFKSNLVKDVVTSYICMIVFPVMIVLVIASSLASKYIYGAAADSVLVAQNAVLDLYREEKRSAAISLSHVVNLNNGQTIAQAAGADGEQQKAALAQLDTMYQLLAAPEYKLLDIQIYRKDGTAVLPRWEMRCTVEEMRDKPWYRAALAQPGQVYTSLEDEDYFYRIRSAQEAMMVSAIAPKNMPDVECIVLYKLSRIPDVIRNYNKSGGTGRTLMVNRDGRPLTAREKDETVPADVMEKILEPGRARQISDRGTRYFASGVPGSGCYVVSAVNEQEMFGRFRLFWAVSLVVIFCVVVMFIVYFKWYMNRLLVPLQRLTEGMTEVEHHNLDTRVEVCSQQDIARMITVFNSMVDQINQLIHEKELAEKDKYQEELLALQSQMNPHFLMNTLNTLKFMAISAHYDGMRDMVTALENILSAVLNRNGGFYSVEEEESVLNSYIFIMQFRYMESFEVDVRIDPEIRDCRVPKLILQPIVENSITHGFDGLDEGQGKVEITGQIKDGNLVFEVLDNGKGMDQELIRRILWDHKELAPLDQEDRPRRRTIGISNTNRRLKLNFGAQYGVEIQSQQGAYTRITLTMPVIRPEGPSSPFSKSLCI